MLFQTILTATHTVSVYFYFSSLNIATSLPLAHQAGEHVQRYSQLTSCVNYLLYNDRGKPRKNYG